MKLVPENLNEVQHFERGLDPKEAMGIGEKYAVIGVWIEDGKKEWDFLGGPFNKSEAELKRDEMSKSEWPASIPHKEHVITWSHYLKISKQSPSFYNSFSRPGVDESLNFERGLDPKVAMGTGLTPEERIKIKQKVPILKRPSPYLGKNDNDYSIYSRGYALWKLLDYIQKEPEGRRYSELVKFYYGEFNSTRTFGMGVFNSLNRYTFWVLDDNNVRTRPNDRYMLNKRGQRFVEKYRSAFEK